ncbi:MAG TPA: FAD-linked oxidase C-terminal domain-containing protein [Acidimicrobiales bacterium]|nr:FAD-linked oxidase C-terminal domain-containing protein [Acidimicrobiales bacterium]
MTAVELGAPGRRADDGQVDLAGLERDLRQEVDGEVRFDQGAKAAYAVDSSNYRQVPIGVVVPRSVAAAVDAVGVCRRHGAPLVSRGGGTSLAGQSCNTAVVIDWSKYCRRVLEVDPAARTCVVEPGIALDDLNAALAPHGLSFGPRPSTHKSCTIGGMIGNNSCGATAQAYGKAADNVVRLEILTYDGEQLWVGPTTEQEYHRILKEGGRRAEIYEALATLVAEHDEEIRQGFPDIPRRVSGYNLDALLEERGFNLARALVGSEGTCVTVLRAELELVQEPPCASLVVLGYPDIQTAARAVPEVASHHPHRLEGLDEVLVDFENRESLHPEALTLLPRGSGWLVVEFRDESYQAAEERSHALIRALRAGEGPPAVAELDDPDREEELWLVREAGLGATARHPSSGRENWEGWEDAAVPPDRLGDYLADFRDLLEEFGYSDGASLYGHFGQGCVHTRLPFDLTTAEGVARFRRFLGAAAELVVSYGGSLSGEHGDGQARGELLETMFGSRLVRAFESFKACFDPGNHMNPGKVVAPDRADQHLRLGPSYTPAEPATSFRYPHDDGRFSKAALRCVGIGNCRGDGGGVMCPSYRVTRDEEHSTRGRARLLWEMLQGHDDSPVGRDGWRSEAVRDALDLCLACKGCKSDCPVSVDMATYKAEFLFHHYRRRLRPAAHYSMGWLPAAARLAAPVAGVANAALAVPQAARTAKRLGGIDPRRQLPRFASPRFSRWFARRTPHRRGDRGQVVLWPDTFTEFFQPWVGAAAVVVLEDAGFEVSLPRGELCCGLTWISTGQLAVARRVLGRTVASLAPATRAGATVVTLEPSCTGVFRADAGELLAGQDTERLAGATRTLGEFLQERAPDWAPGGREGALEGARAIVQQHCHQHALMGYDQELALLGRLGADARLLDDGCCGLAGNFGFEAGHYDVSMACAEHALLPEVRGADADTAVLADGFSCRTQIAEGTDRQASHLAEVLARPLTTDPGPWRG